MSGYFEKYKFTPLGVGFESENEYRNERIWKVNCPGFYKLPNPGFADTAVVICPGGAYFKLNPIYNGFNFGEWLNRMGIHAYVLTHSLPIPVPNAPFDQAAKLIKILRECGYAKIGIWGTSAGGHIAAMTNADFRIMFSPVITMFQLYGHENSRTNLLGKDPAYNLINYYSAERGDGKYYPTFILHSMNDEKVPVENSIMFSEILRKNKVPHSMYLPAYGMHDVCLDYSSWQPILKGWIITQVMQGKHPNYVHTQL